MSLIGFSASGLTASFHRQTEHSPRAQQSCIFSPSHAHSNTMWTMTCTDVIWLANLEAVWLINKTHEFMLQNYLAAWLVCLCWIIYCTGSCHGARKQTCLMGYSPVLSFTALVASVALAASPSCSDFPNSGWADSWRCGKVWSSERLLTERRNPESHPLSPFSSATKVIAELLTSSLCHGCCGGADGGSGGSRSQWCGCFIQEVCVRGLVILPPLVLV